MLRRICETKIEDILGDQFGFRRGKGTMDENRMLKIISEGAFEPEDELRSCFINWQQTFDCENGQN